MQLNSTTKWHSSDFNLVWVFLTAYSVKLLRSFLVLPYYKLQIFLIGVMQFIVLLSLLLLPLYI